MFANMSPEKVGANLKRLIKKSKYRTQERFAQAAGKNIRTVRRWVTDGIDALDTIYLVAGVLEVDVRALLF